jgi:hypothetical protein
VRKIIVMLFAILGFIPLNSVVPTWTAPMTVPLLNSSSVPSSPEVVVDLNGNATAIWVETDSMGNSNIVSSSLPFGSTSWSGPTQLSVAAMSVFPQLAVDSNGDVFAIWIESTNGSTGTVTANIQVASTWGSATSLSTSAMASVPQIASGGNLNAVAVWLEFSQVTSNTCLSGTWGGMNEVISPTGALFPQIAINEVGSNAVASWHLLSAASPFNNNVFVATKTLGGSFGSASIFSDGTDQSVFARVAVDNNGNFIAVWYEYDIGASSEIINVALQARANENGNNQNIATITNYFGLSNPATLIANVEFDSTGNAIAVWNNSLYGSSYYVALSVNVFTNLLNNLPWSTISYPSFNDNYALDCDVAAAGSNSLLIWMHQDPASGLSQILSTLRGLNSTLGSATGTVEVSSSGNNAFPSIGAVQTSSLPPTLYAIAVWVNNTNPPTVNSLQWSNGNWSSTALEPATSLALTPVSTNLGVFTEISKTITWTANPASGVSGYRIYRLIGSDQFLIGQVSSSTTQFVDYNRTGATDTYGIATVDVYGNESAQAVISG